MGLGPKLMQPILHSYKTAFTLVSLWEENNDLKPKVGDHFLGAPTDESVWLTQWKPVQWNPVVHTMDTIHWIQWKAEALSAHLGDCTLMPDRLLAGPRIAPCPDCSIL